MEQGLDCHLPLCIRPLESFTNYINDDKYDFDDSDKSEYSSFTRVDYDENEKLEAIGIYSGQNAALIVDGKDCSDFELQKFMALADDLVSEEKGTAWASYTRQIGIWCPDGDSRAAGMLYDVKPI